MKIAYLCNRYPAVSHSFVRREIAGVEACGHQVVRYTVRAPGELVDEADRAEASRTTAILGQGAAALIAAGAGAAIRSPGRFASAAKLALGAAGARPKELVRAIAYLLEAAWLERSLRRQAVDHLHVHFGTNPTMVARLVRRLGGPHYSFTVHGPDEFDRPEALDLKGKVADAKLAVAISSFGRSQLMRWSSPADWDRIAVVRCGVDGGFLATRPPVASSAPRFAAVARLSGQKGLPVLIEAARILKSRGRDFQLEIAGDGDLRAALVKQIADGGLDHHVHLLGSLDGAGVRALLERSRAFVLPSFAEGLPVVIMEALALERPVIATAIAGTPELVDAGCGWIVPAGSAAAVADAMEAAIDASDATIAAMGTEGRRRVADAHDAERNARSLTRAIEEARAC
ncbi:glycosyltransferase involved in cell wall biosynthesis [Sphingomonas jejuensis]|uniref:Glycosyltransferase involved in cell wall biosynthesis n=1 Tax=Sphingomonas jejuensis TaxID=904715 RepID=A0ABX0XK43_9SPHN|nr:glycosyltransferase family 4 protein [Sphingomonas jejuensis]NJC33723.1 glycosyltransferase involved in cell wall biosynthesis [Sphingomonas jejuensis]